MEREQNTVHEFCDKYSLFNSFPITEQTLCYFATYLSVVKSVTTNDQDVLGSCKEYAYQLGVSGYQEISHLSVPLLKRVQADTACMHVQAMKPGRRPRVRLSSNPRAHLRGHMGVDTAP